MHATPCEDSNTKLYQIQDTNIPDCGIQILHVRNKDIKIANSTAQICMYVRPQDTNMLGP